MGAAGVSSGEDVILMGGGGDALKRESLNILKGTSWRRNVRDPVLLALEDGEGR